jgi:UDP-N-acetylglucosamine--N-acetylmuramyl-(pentapeptide) pyrophosphoryl-undecaprenol N-acetylglucosamine transferase
MLQSTGEKKLKTILLITGGTGGHIFPALAVGEKLSALGITPVFIVRRELKDIELIMKYNYKFITLPSSGFFGKNIMGVLLFFYNFLRSMVLFPVIIFKVKPLAIVASGSFISFAPILWAVVLNIKFFLLEQNRIPGRFTKYFSRWAKEVYLGFPLLHPIKGRTCYTGNPLRPQLLTVSRENSENTILVLGGSQGAQFLNFVAVELASQLPDLYFIIQTGKRDFAKIKSQVKSNNCELIDFTLSPENLYKRAKIAITRAGGMVLSEILLFGIPSIIIPFPFATDNHQAANAQFIAQNGAAINIDQNRQQELSQAFISSLKLIIESLINNRNKLKEMTEKAKRLSKTNAAIVIAERIKLCLAN